MYIEKALSNLVQIITDAISHHHSYWYKEIKHLIEIRPRALLNFLSKYKIDTINHVTKKKNATNGLYL